jgi:hypothetical protein
VDQGKYFYRYALYAQPTVSLIHSPPLLLGSFISNGSN